MFKDRVEVEGYENVYRYVDDDFHAFIALHSTRLGPALGGCRIREYGSDDDALADVLRLAKGMTLKNSAAGLDFGGGKCVVNAPSSTKDIMIHVGEIVEDLHGAYITGEDVGTTVADIQVVATKTSHVLSLGSIGDPSPWTALGVYECIKAARARMFLDDTRLSVWVQGLGKVGLSLAHLLSNNGYKLYVSDLMADRVDMACHVLGAIPYEDHMAYDIDIYAPCALGGVVTAENVNTIMFPIICGSANNQLASDDLATILHHRNVLYCPDYIVNAGGVIAAAAELTGFGKVKVEQDVMELGDVLLNCFLLGEGNGKPPLWGAQRFASIRLGNLAV